MPVGLNLIFGRMSNEKGMKKDKMRIASYRILLPVWLGLLSVSSVWARQNAGQKESVVFSTPKTLYFTGEKIWIDAEVALDDEPSPSQVLYAELVNRNSNSVAYVKMPLIRGKAFNYLQLKSDIPSDHYLLRIYTRISPYLDRELGISQQFVTVINPTIPPVAAAEGETETVSLPAARDSFSKNQKITLPSEQTRGGKFRAGISIANPFLPSEQQAIFSSEVYDALEMKPLIPELFGHVVEVKIPNPKPDATYFLSVHGSQSALFTDIPGDDQRLLVDIGGLKHWDRMIIQMEDGAEMPGIEVVLPLVQTQFKSDFDFPRLALRESDLAYLEKLLKASRVESYYQEKYQVDSMAVVTGFVADYSYDLDAYTRFEDVGTVLREYVPSVLVRTRNRRKEFRLVNEAVKGLFDTNPLILVDAMPVFDSDLLASFNPKFLQKLDVLNREFYLNQRVYPGVLSWTSYQNNFGLYPLAPNARFFDYYGLQPEIVMDRGQFSRPTENGRYPDWRTVLYWEEGTAGLSDVLAPDMDGMYIFWTRSQAADGSPTVRKSYFSVL
jgi:hypothetical protein